MQSRALSLGTEVLQCKSLLPVFQGYKLTGITWTFMDTYVLPMLPWECKLTSLLQQICRHHITMGPHMSSNSTLLCNSKLTAFLEM